MNESHRILVINMGSTSTRLGVYVEAEEAFGRTVNHDPAVLGRFRNIWEQYDYRRSQICDILDRNGQKLRDLDIIVCRGGNTKPVEGGIYEINEAMLRDMQSGAYGRHASNVGNKIAYDLGREFGIPVITVDPPLTDELCAYARYTGLPQIARLSSFHALSQKATARRLAAKLGKRYEELDLIVVHMGGGISIGAHQKGRVIDVNNALDGDGPFSPERAGSLPNAALAKLCYSGAYTLEEMLRMFTGNGGLMALLGTKDAQEIDRRIRQGDQKAEEVFLAMAYKTARSIGAAAATLRGHVDAIAVTGGLAYSERLIAALRGWVEFIAPVYLYPGENEMDALVQGALRYLRGEEKGKPYG